MLSNERRRTSGLQNLKCKMDALILQGLVSVPTELNTQDLSSHRAWLNSKHSKHSGNVS